MAKKLLMVIVVLCLLTSAMACAPAQPETIKIGCVLSTSGLLGGPAGQNMMNAARLAVDEINAAGGVLGKQLELVEADDATEADKCLRQVKRMVEKHNVKVIVGGQSSGAAMASGPYVAQKEVLLVSPSATSTELSNQEWTE